MLVLKVLLLVGALLLNFGWVNGNLPFAILHLEAGSRSADLCALYNPRYSAVPQDLKNTPKYPIYHPFPQDGCDYEPAKEIWNSSLFIKSDKKCPFFDKLQLAYRAHAKQVILISRSKSFKDFPIGTAEQHRQVHLSVGMIGDTSWFKVVETIGTPEFSQLYHPHDPPFDPNLIVLWVIAVFTVVVGAYWSGETLKHAIANNNMNGGDGGEDEDGGYSFPPLSTVMVLVFIVMICLVLLLLYYFYKYLIYVVIGIFALAAVQGSYDCLYGIWSLFSCGRCRVPENNLPLLKSQPEVISIILLFFCIGLSIFWIIVRNSFHAWILQDFLGVCFCISILKMFKLPNLKISAILLLALLVYDIFFVFITPFFSARGKSVMVEVATGHGGLEQLPMVIKVPKVIKTAMSLCERPYSLLGFGDILLPGLFVAFCHNFDVIAKTKYKVYFITVSFGYAFGLFITFVALVLMKSGQPALLYLAPSVLITAVIVGLCRKELKELWTGQIDVGKRRDQADIPYRNIEEEDEIMRKEESENRVTGK